MTFSTLSMATTWTDTSTDTSCSTQPILLTHTYDITDGPNGFVPGTDFAFFGKLFLNFEGFDSSFFRHDTAVIDSGNFIPTWMGSINPGDQNIWLGINALWGINQDGKLDLTVTRLYGTFTLVDSILSVEGCDSSAPIPEPGTVMLLGAGFVGLAVYAKRRKNA